MPAPDWLVAGRVGRPHGLDGSFHVTRPRPALLPLGGALRIAGRDAEIVRRSGTEDRPILRLDVAASREEADALRSEDLLVSRTAAPPLEPEEWYAEELEGLRVVDGAKEVGTVLALQALPSCEVLQVGREGRDELLIPLVRDAVRRVDLAAGTVDVDLAFLDADG
jgi:16S rRNA processing protein RimM